MAPPWFLVVLVLVAFLGLIAGWIGLLVVAILASYWLALPLILSLPFVFCWLLTGEVWPLRKER